MTINRGKYSRQSLFFFPQQQFILNKPTRSGHLKSNGFLASTI